MKNGKYTITDIAQMLEVSRSTVSRAMNGAPGVGEEVRKKVLDLVEKVGYKPNTIAQSLSKGRINIIAMIFGDIRNPFYSDLSFYTQKILNDSGYMVMAFNSEYDEKKELEFIRLADQFHFSGLILLTAQSESIYKELIKVQMPVVLVNRILPSYRGDSVLIDNFKAGYIATMHLIELGHQNIGFITGQDNSSASKQRFEGYCQALNNYNLQYDENNILNGDLKMEKGYQLAKEFVKNIKNGPSGLVIANDMTALGFMECCREQGIKIPEMLSVISFDDIQFSSLYDIRLTTISQHVDKMSEQAARLMLKQLKDPDAEPERIILEPTLMVRNTTSVYKSNRFDNINGNTGGLVK